MDDEAFSERGGMARTYMLLIRFLKASQKTVARWRFENAKRNNKQEVRAMKK